jgi:DNA-directed RNA polymerase specialized sigma24 family protein
MSETRTDTVAVDAVEVSHGPDAVGPVGAAGEFRELAREQLPRLYSIARRLVGEDAEDAVQDCLLKAFQRYGQLKVTDSGPAWLVSILVNCCRDRGRARARDPHQVDFEELERFSLYRKIAYEDPFPYSDSLHLDFLAGFGPEDVREVLLRLPDMYRVPLVWSTWTGSWPRRWRGSSTHRWAPCCPGCTAAGNCSKGSCGTTPRSTA